MEEQGGTVEDGQTVAVIETTASNEDEIILRATIPVPKGTYPRSDGQIPLRIADIDDTLVTTQIEIVSRYPNEADGADVVEVLGRVREPAGGNAGVTQNFYPVVFNPTPNTAGSPGTPGLEDLRQGPANLPNPVRDLLNNANGVILRAYDCFDNEYTCRLFDGSGSFKLERYGPVMTQLRIYQTMEPTTEVAGPMGTLPHFLGVHAYVSTMRDERIVGLDLRFNNAQCGIDPAIDADDPLGKLYFRTIEVSLPDGWSLDQDVDDPFLGSPYSEGGRRIYPLVAPNPDASLHVMGWQSHFHRRLGLAPTAVAGSLFAYHRQVGQGFATRGVDAASGEKYWSWWTPWTARYFPQNVTLPSLEHVGRANVRGTLAAELTELRDVLEQGTTTNGLYPVPLGVMGWAHAYGVTYGGMTSGAEIHISDGIRVAESAARTGYEAFKLIHRMHSARMPVALYKADGDMSSVEDWLISPPGGEPYVPWTHFGRPTLRNDDAMGLYLAPTFQVDYVASQGLAPPYEATLLSYDPHDYQHYIRYTRSPKVLVWLGNDALARDDLVMAAESFHFGFHRHRNDQYSGWQGDGLYGVQQFVEENPNWGLPYGRGEGWGLDAMSAAYAVADPTWRAEKKSWFPLVARLVADGMSNCSGFIQAGYSNKVGHNLYRGRQMIEHAIVDNALKGMLETVFRGDNAAMTALTEEVLEDSLYAGISNMAWFPGQSGPWSYTAVGPLDLDLPLFCNQGQLPADGYVATVEAYQNWSSFAYAYYLTTDNAFLNKAEIQLGGGELLFELEQEGTSNLPNQAALLSMAQRLNGNF